MSSFTYLQTANIQKIFDLQTGIELDATELVGDDERALILRTTLRKEIERGEARYVCPVCFKPIYLCSNPGKTGQYFAHRDVDSNCPKLEQQNVSQEVIRAIKYNGAKESQAHYDTKKLLLDSLRADPKFSDEKEEEIWKSKFKAGKFRRPDVRATYHGQKGDLRIAFEVQLSTTFLSEIVQRSEFYLKEGALLIWVFRRFVEKGPKLTQLDIFYPNNLNAFVVNQETRNISVNTGRLNLRCHWAEPIIANTEIDQKLCEQIIPFSSLTLDQAKQQAYFFDYDSAKASAEEDIKQRKLEEIGEELKKHCRLRHWEFDDSVVQNLRTKFAEYGYIIPRSPGKLHRLIKCILSLQEGFPVGSGQKHLIELGNMLYQGDPDDLFFFLAASNAYNRKDELIAHGDAQKWNGKKEEVWNALVDSSTSKFQWNEDTSDFVFLLFPAVKTEFEQLVSQIERRRKTKLIEAET